MCIKDCHSCYLLRTIAKYYHAPLKSKVMNVDTIFPFPESSTLKLLIYSDKST